MKNHDTLYGVLDNIGAVLGPILGIVMADFFIVRRRLAVRDLYQPDGIYRASGGYNLVAIGVFLAVTAVLIIGEYAPPVGIQDLRRSLRTWRPAASAGGRGVRAAMAARTARTQVICSMSAIAVQAHRSSVHLSSSDGLSAPTATRTRDLLLRRQSLYPLSYRGLPWG